MRLHRSGFTIMETIIVGAISAIFALTIIPSLFHLSQSLRVRMAAMELVGVLRSARQKAILSKSKVAVKFDTGLDHRVTFTLYRDGDGDGVLNKDIDSGIDPSVGPSRALIHLGRKIRFGFPSGRAPTDPSDSGKDLTNLDDPIRFNRSDLASFGPLGGSTPGSLYITDGQRHLSAVRVFGYTGKVKILVYNPESRRWR
jgi:type II secretory pathway pseudopilin PulG